MARPDAAAAPQPPTPLNPAREERREAAGPKAESPSRVCPLPHPPSPSVPAVAPDPACPTRPGSRCKEMRHRRICFLGQPAPSAPPRRPLSPEARSPRPCPGPWSGKSPGRGAGGAGHTKGPLWSGSKHSPGKGAVPALWLGEGRGAQARAPVLRLGAGPTHLARQVQPQAPCRSLLLPPHLLEMKGEVGRESGLRWPQEGGQIELLRSCVLPFPHPVAL